MYLISSGTSPEESYYVDNSESGDDVFFVTSAGLVAQDTDGSADMYDARVHADGRQSAAERSAVQRLCRCRGPPSTPELLGAPPSETFSGPGNPVAAPKVKPAVTAKPKAKAKTKKKKKRKKSGKSKRRAHGSSRHGKGKKATSGRGK